MWVKGDSPKEIEEVVYTLHTSFCNPVRRTKDRDSQFKTQDIASSSFTIFASIRLADGSELKMEKHLHIGDDNHGLAPATKSNKAIILVVDDDADVLRTVMRDLRSRYGRSFELKSALSGQQGLEILGAAKATGKVVALMVSDERMPDMRGIEFLSLASECYPAAKKVLLTAYLDADAAIGAINISKVDHYLMKTWDPPEENLYPVLDDLLSGWLPIRADRFNGW